MVQPLHIKGAQIWDWRNTGQRDLYMTNHIVEKPAAGAMTVDLEGYTIFPGLINAHDHLELNHYPRSKFREVYDNAHQWGEDMNARLDTEPYKSLRAYPLWDKLFIGGLKNLLCGATTVIHHNPPHKELWRKDFPVRVLRKYGWAHSLHFSTDEEVVASYRSTPPDVPWFIHLAEGTDEVAAGEYQRLKALGCIGKNTVIVHGVGLDYNDAVDFYLTIGAHVGNGIKLVVCPSTNRFLLNSLIDIHIPARVASTMIGSDSRLTSQGDLLDELRFTYEYLKISPRTWVLGAVTHEAGNVLQSEMVGKVENGYCANFIAVHSGEDDEDSLCHAHRADLAMVVYDGIPRIGSPDIMAKFPHIQTVPARLDGVEKAIHINLAQQIHACKLQEPGLEVAPLPTGRRWWF